MRSVDPAISAKTARELTDEACQFLNQKGWEKVLPHELFGIRDPKSGTLRVVTFHPDEPGRPMVLRCHTPSDQSLGWRMAEGESRLARPAQSGHMILECRFLPPNLAETADRAFVAGCADRNRKMVPCFRSFRPGYVPWLFDEEEAQLFITVFKLFQTFQNVVIPNRHQFFQWEHPFGPHPGIPVFHLVGEDHPNDPSSWEIETEVLPSKCLAPAKPRPSKDPLITQLAGKRVLNETWEVAAFFVPTPTFDGPRPYFPKSAVCLRAVHVGSACPCSPIVYGGEDTRGDVEVIREAFRNLAQHCRYLPERVRVDSEIALAALETYADEFGIELITDEEQEFMPKLIEEVLDFFEKSLPNPDEEILSQIINAIPEEFRSTVSGEEELEDSVSRLAAQMEAEADAKFALFEMPPANVIYGDFYPHPPGANQLD